MAGTWHEQVAVHWHEQVAVHSGYSVKKEIDREKERRIGKILLKISNTEFCKNPTGGSQVVRCGQTQQLRFTIANTRKLYINKL